MPLILLPFHQPLQSVSPSESSRKGVSARSSNSFTCIQTFHPDFRGFNIKPQIASSMWYLEILGLILVKDVKNDEPVELIAFLWQIAKARARLFELAF